MRSALHTELPRLLSCLALLCVVVLTARTVVADPDEAVLPPPLAASQLDELVGPIALYPDVVLDSLLPATVAPDDVAAAARFLASRGGRVQGAPDGVTWDVGLVALLQFPDVLEWMGENPQWVERMGFAVAMQQGDVLAAIQRFRVRAQRMGVLDDSPYLLVESGPQIIIRTPSPRIVYVPVYDAWALDSWRSGRPFYRSWLSFSFGSRGYWGRYHIFWGAGIYDYGEPWWWGRWRSPASDWRVGRPVRWVASRSTSQPWTRTGWRASGWGTRVALPSTTVNERPALRINVALPAERPTTRLRVRARWQPTAPAAPITHWSQTTRPRSGTGSLTPTRPRAASPERTPGPLQLRPTAPVIYRGPVQQWSRRGHRSLEREPSSGPSRIVPTPQGRRPAPLQQPGDRPAQGPRVEWFPPSRAGVPIPDGRRARAHDRRGNRVLRGA